MCDGTVPGSQGEPLMLMQDADHTEPLPGALYLWPYLCDFFASSSILEPGPPAAGTTVRVF